MSWTKVLKAKLYNVEYVKPGDGISNFIGNIKVEANDEKEALAIAEQKRPDGWNFKIINKNYENVDIVNKDSKVEHEYSSGYWDGYRYRTESKNNYDKEINANEPDEIEDYSEQYNHDDEDDMELEFIDNEMKYNYNGKDYYICGIIANIYAEYVEDSYEDHYMSGGEDNYTTHKYSRLDDYGINEIKKVELYDEDKNEIIEITDNDKVFNDILNNDDFMKIIYKQIRWNLEN